MTSKIEEKDRRVIIGMGLTGLSCARYFSSLGLSFVIMDSRENPPLKHQFEKEFPQIEKQYGAFSERQFNNNDLLVVSPGVALKEPAIAHALNAGAVLSSDIELFIENCDKPIIAITGSNGKSTVTTLVGEILKQAGRKVCVAGNIGEPVLDQLLSDKVFDICVLELSSFQLERLNHFSSEVATILNVTEDHMDRYNSFKEYQQAKQMVFVGAKNIVINREDPLTNPEKTTQAKIYQYGLGAPENNSFGLLIADNQSWIAFGKEHLLASDELKIRGLHNVLNAMAAMAICYAVGVGWQPMIEALKSFKGLRHRCEWVAEVKGVTYYNDSKATNVGAAIAAINGFSAVGGSGHLILIAGGLDKDSDFAPMAEVVRSSIEKVFLIGRDAKKIELAIGSDLCSHSKDLRSAVNDASLYAKEGDVVLFSPACASFDMFKNYEERGDVFVDAVKALAG